jgi:formylmethanofuran dehydrogenase subunit E
MTMLKHDRTEKLEVILKKAEEFHGRLEPFLTLGVRMGLIGVRELGAQPFERRRMNL